MATYEIIIKNETRKKKKSPVAEPTPSEEKKSSQDKQEKSAGQTAVTAGLVAWNQVKPWITQTVSHEVNMVELRTGRREYAQKTQLTYQIVSDVVGIGESALAGYAVGNIPGAIIGAVLGLGHKLANLSQQQDRINTERMLENVSIQQNRIRAGVSGSRRV